MRRIQELFHTIYSRGYFLERVFTLFIVISSLIGNFIEYYSGKPGEDPAFFWMFGVVLGAAVFTISLSKWRKYTEDVFSIFLYFTSLNIIVGYYYSLRNTESDEVLYQISIYGIIATCAQVIKSKFNLRIYLFQVTVSLFIAVFISTDFNPLLLNPMHQFVFLYVVLGSYYLGIQRINLTKSDSANIEFKSLSDHARDVQLILNFDLKVLHSNPAAQTLFNIGKGVQMDLATFLNPVDLERITSIINESVLDPSIRKNVEYKIYLPDGSYKWAESIFSILESEGRSNRQLVFAETRDITRRKKLEEALQFQIDLEQILLVYSNQLITTKRRDINLVIRNCIEEFTALIGADFMLVYESKNFSEVMTRSIVYKSPNADKIDEYFPKKIQLDINQIYEIKKGTSHQSMISKLFPNLDMKYQQVNFQPVFFQHELTGFIAIVSQKESYYKEIYELIASNISSGLFRLHTETKLAEANATNESILKVLPSWLYFVNGEGTFTGFNQFSKLTPYLDANNLLGKSFFEIFGNEIASLYNSSLFQVIETDLAFNFEYEQLQAGGHTHYYSAILAPFKVNEYMVIIRDITRLKSAEEELEQKNKKLEQSNKELEEFAFIVSHDLKQPIRSITSYLTLLKKRYQSIIDADGNEFIEFCLASSNRMASLVTDILKFSKMDQQIEFSDTYLDLDKVMLDFLKSYETQIQQQEIQFNYPKKLPTIRCKETLTTEVFQNLIENAIKYNRKSRKEINIDWIDKASYFQFDISDNGIGFKKEHADKIFKMFARLHKDETEFQGTGIGLAVCKKAIEKQGGKIWVNSVEGIGTKFSFTLPK